MEVIVAGEAEVAQGGDRAGVQEVQAGEIAAIEHGLLQLGDALRQGDAGQAGAVEEAVLRQAGDAVLSGDIGQGSAHQIQALAVLGFLGDLGLHQLGAAKERPVAHRLDGVAEVDLCDAGVVEGIVADALEGAGQPEVHLDAVQGIDADLLQPLGQIHRGDGGLAPAGLEGIVTDDPDGIQQGNAGDLAAEEEGLVADGGDGVGLAGPAVGDGRGDHQLGGRIGINGGIAVGRIGVGDELDGVRAGDLVPEAVGLKAAVQLVRRAGRHAVVPDDGIGLSGGIVHGGVVVGHLGLLGRQGLIAHGEVGAGGETALGGGGDDALALADAGDNTVFIHGGDGLVAGAPGELQGVRQAGGQDPVLHLQGVALGHGGVGQAQVLGTQVHIDHAVVQGVIRDLQLDAAGVQAVVRQVLAELIQVHDDLGGLALLDAVVLEVGVAVSQTPGAGGIVDDDGTDKVVVLHVEGQLELAVGLIRVALEVADLGGAAVQPDGIGLDVGLLADIALQRQVILAGRGVVPGILAGLRVLIAAVPAVGQDLGLADRAGVGVVVALAQVVRAQRPDLVPLLVGDGDLKVHHVAADAQLHGQELLLPRDLGREGQAVIVIGLGAGINSILAQEEARARQVDGGKVRGSQGVIRAGVALKGGTGGDPVAHKAQVGDHQLHAVRGLEVDVALAEVAVFEVLAELAQVAAAQLNAHLDRGSPVGGNGDGAVLSVAAIGHGEVVAVQTGRELVGELDAVLLRDALGEGGGREGVGQGLIAEVIHLEGEGEVAGAIGAQLRLGAGDAVGVRLGGEVSLGGDGILHVYKARALLTRRELRAGIIGAGNGGAHHQVLGEGADLLGIIGNAQALHIGAHQGGRAGHVGRRHGGAAVGLIAAADDRGDDVAAGGGDLRLDGQVGGGTPAGEAAHLIAVRGFEEVHPGDLIPCRHGAVPSAGLGGAEGDGLLFGVPQDLAALQADAAGGQNVVIEGGRESTGPGHIVDEDDGLGAMILGNGGLGLEGGAAAVHHGDLALQGIRRGTACRHVIRFLAVAADDHILKAGGVVGIGPQLVEDVVVVPGAGVARLAEGDVLAAALFALQEVIAAGLAVIHAGNGQSGIAGGGGRHRRVVRGIRHGKVVAVLVAQGVGVLVARRDQQVDTGVPAVVVGFVLGAAVIVETGGGAKAHVDGIRAQLHGVIQACVQGGVAGGALLIKDLHDKKLCLGGHAEEVLAVVAGHDARHVGAVGLGGGIAANGHVGVVVGIGDLGADPGVGSVRQAGGELGAAHHSLQGILAAVNGGAQILGLHGERLVILGDAGVQDGNQRPGAGSAVEAHLVDLVRADHADAVGHGQVVAALVLRHVIGAGLPDVLDAGQGLGLRDLAVGHGHGEAVQDGGVVITVRVCLVAAERRDLGAGSVVAAEHGLLQRDGAAHGQIGGHIPGQSGLHRLFDERLLLHDDDDLHQIGGGGQIAALFQLNTAVLAECPVTAAEIDRWHCRCPRRPCTPASATVCQPFLRSCPLR